MENEDQLNKIRALLAKAESTDFPKEAESYTAKAMGLISKWGIDQSLLEAKAKSTAIVDRVFTLVAPFARDKVTLLFAIATAFGARSVLINSKYGSLPGERRLHVFATETDMERIDMVFTSLLVQCSTAMNYAVAVSEEAKRQPRKFKSDFLYGFSDQVGYRLGAAEREAAKNAEAAATEQGTSTALVLVSKKDQIDARVEEIYKELKSSSRGSRAVGGGYGHGRDAGKRADIGGKKSAGKGALVG